MREICVSYNDQKFKKKEVFIMGIKGFKIGKKREKELDYDRVKIMNKTTGEITIHKLENWSDLDKVLNDKNLCLVLD